ncbi:MAG: type VI secretion system tip protein TssI/VgrG [Candidatus Thiodiazotropha sp.]
MSFTQTNRQIRISTPLGADKLLLSSFYANETLGRVSVYHAELLSEDASIALEHLLGQRVGIELDLADGGSRYFDAFVSRFTQIGESGNLARYHAVLHPWLWFLTRTSDCRIYQNLDAPAILKEVFDENGFSDYQFNLSNSYRTREYCVQYRETDFNFVSRLMEEEGIYYFFSHEAGKHTLVLCDNYGSHAPLAGGSELPYQPLMGSGGQRGKESVTRWQLSKGVKPGRYAHTDYDFKKPRAALLANAPLTRSHPYGDYEIFDFPGSYEQAAEGESYARQRIEELQAVHEQLQGESDIRQIAVGGLFTLSGHPRADQNREYLITEATIELHANSYGSGSSGGGGEVYRCEFSCIDGKESFRSQRTTPKPIVQGPQTAVVAGRGGEEIYTDENGRVKVQFQCELYGESNENSSCWVRVAQPWAGKNWGAMSIPRIGQEVVVEFLEGDPDRPLITGSVYNAEQMPPYGLPANMTQSGIKSRSTKGGSGSNFNEIRFEDKKGSEQLFIHAEKNQDNVVKNDETTSIGHDRRETVDHDETITVGNDHTASIGNNETITITADRTETVGANETVSIGSSRTVNIGINKSETVGVSKFETIGLGKALSIGGAYQVSVGAVMNETVGAAKAMQVVNSLSEMIGNNRTVKVGKNQTTTIGDSDKLNVGKNLVIDAGDSVVIKTGKASITMKKDGTVTIQGKNITVKGSGVVNAKACKNMILKGKKVLQN